jgi:hypothetical protein
MSPDELIHRRPEPAIHGRAYTPDGVTSIADHQRAMLALVVADPTAAIDDPYAAAISDSLPLDVVRDIADSWRRFALQRLCPLTWRLMEQRGRLDHHFVRLARRRGLSPFLQILARQFLDQVADETDDALEAAVVRFERMLIDAPLTVDDGATSTGVVIDWPCDPEQVLGRLATGVPLGTPTQGRYRTRAPSLDPTVFTIECLS